MSYRRDPFEFDEWYHCYTRGVDRRTTFENVADFQRFLQLLYLSNSSTVIERGLIKGLSHREILSIPRGEPLITLGAYCLMGNHFHLLIKETSDGGITKFMQKVLTGYTMYFNIKRERVGSLFVTPFRSRHVSDDRYLRQVTHYIHLNSAEIFEPRFKSGAARSLERLERAVRAYPYSSLPDYVDRTKNRAERALLDDDVHQLLPSSISFRTALREAHEYYKDLMDLKL